MPARSTLSDKDRFMSWVTPVTESGCWIWHGCSDPKGYGRFRRGGERATVLSHRFSWEMFRGGIPTGMFVCHKCDTPACVNPDHLWLGTNADNVADMDAKSRRNNPHPKPMRGENHYRAKFTDDDIRRIKADNRTQEAIASEYGVRQNTISRIKSGVRWGHLC